MGNRILIINADDLGYDPAVTRGILEAMRAGLVSSATLMRGGASMPWESASPPSRRSATRPSEQRR